MVVTCRDSSRSLDAFHGIERLVSVMKRLAEFEGLRGFLAWWVVLTHILAYSGISASRFTLLKDLWNGAIPVNVFIILSGFVIFYLLSGLQEGYGAFIIRRFFRIYPVFVVCLGLALVLNVGRQAAFAQLPWSGEPQMQKYLDDCHRVD